MKKILLAVYALSCFCLNGFAQTVSTVAPQVTDSVKIKPVVVPAGFTSQLNVVYTKVNDWDGRMDLYLPPASSKPTPVIINIHGGGWNHGAKEEQGGFAPYFKAGFAVANMEYRLTSQATAPAAIEDTRCVLIYLIKNAKALNIDPNKIIIMGGSAGGHLALMGGLLQNNHIFDTAFQWDTTKNLLVEVCFSNSSAVTNGNAIVNSTNAGFNATLYNASNTTGLCNSRNVVGTTQLRPNMQINGLFPYTDLLAPNVVVTSSTANGCNAVARTVTATITSAIS